MGIDYTHKKHGGEWGGNLISRPGKTKFRETIKGPQTGQTKTEKTRVHGTFKESGAPGTNRKLHKKSSKRLNEIMRLKEKKRQTRTGPGTEKARKKRLSHLQSGGYKAGGRAKHGLGSLVKKGISKILKPKPKGVPVKPVPKSVTDKPTGWSPKGSYTEADDKKITSILKKLGDEIKAAPLPPKLKATLKKAREASPHKKAEGGRIGFKHGSYKKVPTPHADIAKYVEKDSSKSPEHFRKEGSTMKVAKSRRSAGATRRSAGRKSLTPAAGRKAARAGYKHGGSVGAAVRGHGAEIK